MAKKEEYDYMLSVTHIENKTEVQVPFSSTEEDADDTAVDLIYTLFPDIDTSELEYDYWRV